MQNFSAASLPLRPHERQHKHGEKDRKQSYGSGSHIDTVLRQDRGTSINELKMHPVDQQGSLAQLNQRTESPLRCSPAAPGIARCQNYQQHADPKPKEVWACMPVVVGRVKVMWLGVEPAGGGNQHYAGRSCQKEDRRFTFAGPLTLQNESSGKPGEGECSPGKNGEEPGLRCTQVVDAVD